MKKKQSQVPEPSPEKGDHLPGGKRWSTPWAILLLILMTLCLIAPFSDKAFHIDDPLFLWAARHISSHPADPYGFKVTWYFDEMEMSEVTKNPPFASYYIAFVSYFVGWSERALHLAFLLPAVASVLGAYFLARKLCMRPLLASLVGLITPIFVLSGTTVMCDTMMLAFWVWAILLWIRGTESEGGLALALSGLLVAMSALTKYYGMSLIMLLALYSFAKNRKVGFWLTYLMIPVVILLLYQWKTDALYGRGLLLDAAAYAREFRGSFRFDALTKGIVGLGFVGGCLISLLFYLPFVWSRRTLLIQLPISIAVILLLSLRESIGVLALRDAYGVTWPEIIQLGIMVMIGMNVLALAGADLWNHKGDASSLLLFCWMMGTFIFAGFVNWSVNGRSILPMAPAVGILLARRIEQRAVSYPRRSTLFWPLAPALCATLLVTWADYGWANASRSAAEAISKKYLAPPPPHLPPLDHAQGREPVERLEGGGSYRQEQKRLRFQGHWGFQYYMETYSARIVEMNQYDLLPGDILIVPENNTYTFPVPPTKMVRPLETVEIFPPCRWLTIMNRFTGAGFYSDLIGPLPFVIGPALPERYNILRIEPFYVMPDTLTVPGKDDNEYDRAIRRLTQALFINVFHAETFFNRAAVFIKNGEYDKAISDLTQVLTITPHYPDIFRSRGNAYLLKEDYKRAISDYAQALRMEPRDAKTYLNRGFAYFKEEAYDKAWKDVREAERLGVSVDPAFLEKLRSASGSK